MTGQFQANLAGSRLKIASSDAWDDQLTVNTSHVSIIIGLLSTTIKETTKARALAAQNLHMCSTTANSYTFSCNNNIGDLARRVKAETTHVSATSSDSQGLLTPLRHSLKNSTYHRLTQPQYTRSRRQNETQAILMENREYNVKDTQFADSIIRNKLVETSLLKPR